ncbi:MAG: hypothetical protein IPJ95_18545 [Gemmatimonadetes bacterium]|jgi:hypothetical protein|nr:hypothetical protein [Gemmatimonadota bacterium]MBP6669127.1 hypothetical protein [Gemmatimonadales bacterium]MBK7350020.1 hypothetical protein [Gemmatimonadota bacterium]MBK7784648.1 hypothetical protein [Gemmatimonadota bacterium]MBK7925601.1 hypothetical protein [Gemmatimonadota bacterium]
MPVSLPAWLRATWLGWILGIPFVILFALLGESLGIGGAQVMVGLGMGAGVGLLQGRALRGILGRAVPWAVATAVGLALPFLVTDIAGLRHWDLAYSLTWCVISGGLIVGVWQALLLRGKVPGAGWWVAASAAGWALAAVTAAYADRLSRGGTLRGLGGAALYLGTMTGGGLALGLATGVAIARLTRPS